MIDHYRGMLDDPVRMAAFERAIAQTVRPGDVVADIGTGLGTFALFACRAGAARVWAVERGPILEVAREVVRANGCADRVRFLSGLSTELEVPERARVVIFEDFVTTLISPALVDVLRDLRARWLADGGTLLPPRARRFMAPIEDRLGHQATDCFAGTSDRVAGLDFSITRKRAFSSMQPRRLGPGALLAEPILVDEIDLGAIEDVSVNGGARAIATRHGLCHGIALWFELWLGGQWLSTGPEAPTPVWLKAVFPLETPIAVAPGEPIELALECAPFGGQPVWRWSVATAGRRCAAHSLDGAPLEAGVLALQRPDHVPTLSREAEIERAVLAAVDGRKSIGAIAAEIAARFPERFPTADAALARVAELLGRFQ